MRVGAHSGVGMVFKNISVRVVFKTIMVLEVFEISIDFEDCHDF